MPQALRRGLPLEARLGLGLPLRRGELRVLREMLGEPLGLMLRVLGAEGRAEREKLALPLGRLLRVEVRLAGTVEVGVGVGPGERVEEGDGVALVEGRTVRVPVVVRVLVLLLPAERVEEAEGQGAAV